MIINTKKEIIIKWDGWEHLKKNSSLISLYTVHHTYVRPWWQSQILIAFFKLRVYNRIISTCSDALLSMRRDLFVLLERTIHQFDNGCTRTINAIHSVMASVDIADHHSPKQTANNQNLSSRVWFIQWN